jgi:hypothetical protein
VGAANIARARALLAAPSPAKESKPSAASSTDEPRMLPCPCPCCGGRMIIIETLGQNNLYHLSSDGLEPITMVMLEFRRGRPVEKRLALGRAIVDVCVELLGVACCRSNIAIIKSQFIEAY